MKTTHLSAIVLGLLAACSSPSPAPNGNGDLLLAASLQRAIVAQSTLFPYHFVSGSGDLNSLGQRDVAVLAHHLMEHAGSVTVRRGEVAAEVHEARVRAVITALEAAGVARNHVTVHDGLPGGDGMASMRVVEVMKAPLVLSGAGISTATATASSTTGSGTSPSANP